MNENETITAWEKVLAIGDAPIGEHWGCSITTKLAKETFDTLNRQNAEIERLREENKIATQKRANIFELIDKFEEGRVKGAKEFAERLKAKGTSPELDEGKYYNDYDIDRTLAEMESESNV